MNQSQKTPPSKYSQEIQAMMFTFGDCRNSFPSTVQLMEEIVHTQMIDLIQKTYSITSKRGSRFLTVDDFIFVVRHDQSKVRRLKEFLSWKDIRKNVRSNAGENAEDLDICDDDELKVAQSESPQATKPPTARRRVAMNWEYFESMIEKCDQNADDEFSDFEEYLNDTKERLREADLMTKEMTKEEYMEYSECRQASFTFKKAKKFRDWLCFSKYVEAKPNDDVLEILGFLAWEIVRIITETALKVKNRYEKCKRKHFTVDSSVTMKDILLSKNWAPHGEGQDLLEKYVKTHDTKKLAPNLHNGENSEVSSNSSSSIFERPDRRTPLEAEHLYEACRLLEKSNDIFWMFSGGHSRKSFSPIC